MNMNKVEMNDNMMELVYGGTFTSNALSNSQYEKYGIRVDKHFFARDEFYLPSNPNVAVNEKEANDFIIGLVGKEAFNKMKDEYASKRNFINNKW